MLKKKTPDFHRITENKDKANRKVMQIFTENIKNNWKTRKWNIQIKMVDSIVLQN